MTGDDEYIPSLEDVFAQQLKEREAREAAVLQQLSLSRPLQAQEAHAIPLRDTLARRLSNEVSLTLNTLSTNHIHPDATLINPYAQKGKNGAYRRKLGLIAAYSSFSEEITFYWGTDDRHQETSRHTYLVGIDGNFYDRMDAPFISRTTRWLETKTLDCLGDTNLEKQSAEAHYRRATGQLAALLLKHNVHLKP